MSNCELSIITPVYNGQQFLDRYAKSLLNIDIANREIVEIVLVDDGSTDNSFTLMQSLAKQLQDFNNINLIQQSNAGSSSARNAGIQQARGKWMMFIDIDDELAADPVPLLQQNNQRTCLLFSIEIYRNDKIIKHVTSPTLNSKKIKDRLSAENPLHPPMAIFKTESIQTLFDTGLTYLEDWYFWLTNLSVFESCHTYPNICIAKIHAHTENKSGHYHQIGFFRSKIAQQISDAWHPNITRKQKNHLLIQNQIGQLMSNQKKSLRTFFLVPCSSKLWLKLVIYTFCYGFFKRHDVYSHQ